jgi:hypothetical protein
MFTGKTIIRIVIFVFSCFAFAYECFADQTSDSLVSSLKDRRDDSLKVKQLAVLANGLASHNPKEVSWRVT